MLGSPVNDPHQRGERPTETAPVAAQPLGPLQQLSGTVACYHQTTPISNRMKDGSCPDDAPLLLLLSPPPPPRVLPVVLTLLLSLSCATPFYNPTTLLWTKFSYGRSSSLLIRFSVLFASDDRVALYREYDVNRRYRGKHARRSAEVVLSP